MPEADDDPEKASVKITITNKDAKLGAATEGKLPAVTFTQLFRFSTRLEIWLNILGVAAALLAGAAQVKCYILASSVLSSSYRCPLRSKEFLSMNSLCFPCSLVVSLLRSSASGSTVSFLQTMLAKDD